jgi:hypothetical protein
MDINLKDIDEQIADKLSQMAEDKGVSRSSYLKELVGKYVNKNYILLHIPYDCQKAVSKRINSNQLEEDQQEKSAVVSQSLSRYFRLLARASVEMPDFTTPEVSLLAEIFNGTIIDFAIDPRQYLKISTEDFFAFNTEDNQYSEKWSVNKKDLLEKINQLTILQSAFLLDGIERFWRDRSENFNKLSFEQQFKKLRLVR